jgi:very-short-patch-repair endonuclease
MREGQKTGHARRLRKAMTRAEIRLWKLLREEALGWKFRRQHPVGSYIADFACLPACLIVEVDGATHGSDDEVAYDRRRTAALEALGWRVVRVWNGDVLSNADGVLRLIREALWEQQNMKR